MEYALGLDPRADSAAQAPRWASAGDHWELRVRPSPDAPGVACTAEWSADLRPDSWQPAADEGDATEHAFRVPVGTHPALYVRWRVTVVP